MYEMEGALPTRRTSPASHPASLALRAAHQGQAPARATGFPISPASRSFLRVVPVSGGESISTPSAGTAQELLARLFSFFLHPHVVHRYRAVFRRWKALSTELLTACPQITAGNSGHTKWLMLPVIGRSVMGHLGDLGALVAAAAPARLALVQERPHPFPRVGNLAGRGHDLDGVGVGLGLVQVDLGV